MLKRVLFTALVIPFLFLSIQTSVQQASAQTPGEVVIEDGDIMVLFRSQPEKNTQGKGATAVDALQGDGSSINYDGPLRIEDAETYLYSVCPNCSPGHCCWYYIGGNWVCRHEFCPIHP